jgi:hypothetical protein
MGSFMNRGVIAGLLFKILPCAPEEIKVTRGFSRGSAVFPTVRGKEV